MIKPILVIKILPLVVIILYYMGERQACKTILVKLIKVVGKNRSFD